VLNWVCLLERLHYAATQLQHSCKVHMLVSFWSFQLRQSTQEKTHSLADPHASAFSVVSTVSCRPMSPDHPERNAKAFVAYWQSGNHIPSLQCYIDYVRGKEKSTAALAGIKRPRKPAGLQYSDLYGVPTILVLCEKGKVHSGLCEAKLGRPF
jgi:hypothetical protein